MQTVKGNVQRGYAQASWGKEGQGSATIALTLHPPSSRPPGEAGLRRPWELDVVALMCHIPLTYTTSTEVLSVPGPPNLSLFFLCCFFHLPFCVSVRKISKCRGWASFSGRQGSAKHFQLPQYETDFPWEHAQPASTTGTALEGTYQESLPSYQKKKNVSENSSVGKNDSVDFISFDK